MKPQPTMRKEIEWQNGTSWIRDQDRLLLICCVSFKIEFLVSTIIIHHKAIPTGYSSGNVNQFDCSTRRICRP
jgi:hypothetical protein